MCIHWYLQKDLFGYRNRLGGRDSRLNLKEPWRKRCFSPTLSQNRFQYFPAIPERIQIARTMNALVLEAGHLGNLEASHVHANIDQRLYFKSITVNFYVVETMSPESVIAIAQIGEACHKKR